MRVLGFVGVNWFNRETESGSITSVGLHSASAAKRKTQSVSVKGLVMDQWLTKWVKKVKSSTHTSLLAPKCDPDFAALSECH